MIIKNQTFHEDGLYLMGILNVTPDSFSDGGRYTTLDAALYQAEKMVQEGADLIDVGGESTRPGHAPVSVEQEIDRVVPVLEALRARFEVPLSLDTSKVKVAEAAVPFVDLINDVWGFRREPALADLVAREHLSCCLMHNGEVPREKDFWTGFLEDVQTSLDLALTAGVPKERILLDAGVGFAKTYEENLMVLQRTRQIKELGYPVLIAASRKSFIQKTLDRPLEERLPGTLAVTAWGAMQGASFFRVHDVAANRDVLGMIRSLSEGKQWMP
ncbi:Dihydropteroate synthase [Clostridiaceae bacterium JG1575]|nr:Dihydropteroate synthase [Clostridiaceae bacterium JG1575]